MPKEFYTERDIEDMVKRGILSLELSDGVVLTDLAYEKANKLGMRLVQEKPFTPPAAPVRPYIAQQSSPPFASATPSVSPQPHQTIIHDIQPVVLPQSDRVALHQRIRDAVIARLGNQVDANLLDVIITRVLKNSGVK
jgi:hypothetical protein